MDITVRRNLNQTNMIISDQEGSQEDDSLQMILQNEIPCLLPIETESIDGKLRLVYNVSALTALNDTMESGSIRQENLRNLVHEIGSCMERLREYLLDTGQLLLRPECIFTDQKRKVWKFCMNPFYRGSQQKDLQKLFERIIACIDYEDQELVRMAYEMFMAVQEENISWKELENIIFQNEDTEEVVLRDFFTDFDEKQKKMLPDMEENASRPDNRREYPVSDLPKQLPGEDTVSPGFLQKLKMYLKGKRFRDVMEDIEDGLIFQKIQMADDNKSTGTEFGTERVQGKKERILAAAGTGKHSTIVLTHFPFSIGKTEGKSDYILDCETVSRNHVCLYRDPGEKAVYYIEDQKSRNGTYVNGVRIGPNVRTRICPGDHIRLSELEYIFQ